MVRFPYCLFVFVGGLSGGVSLGEDGVQVAIGWAKDSPSP